MPLSSSDLLARLVAFDTTSHRSNLPLIEWVQGYLLDLGIESWTLFDAGRAKANLFASVGPPDAGGVCLHGHTDVVPVDGQPWQTDPFSLTRRDDLLFGRGTSDMKAWIACCLAAFAAYARRPLRTPIHLALSYDEEVGCLGAPGLIAAFGNRVPKPLVAFVGEPTLMAPVTAHKGLIAVDTTITGRDAHASLLHLGVSAIAAAGEMAAELHERAAEWMDLPGPPGMRPSGPTLNVGRISGGVARNVIAREARLMWELRYRAHDAPDELLDEILERVRQRLDRAFGVSAHVLLIESMELARVPAFDAGLNGPAELLARRCGALGDARGVPYGTEAGQYAAAGVPAVVCGPGSIEQAHQPNEFIATSQLAACDEFLARLGDLACVTGLRGPGSRAC
jgi:acetylornithine deacetylase